MEASDLSRRVVIVLVAALAVVAGFWVVRASAASATPVVYVATGENFPDALGASSAAAVSGGPVLLVQKDRIPSVTKAELQRLQPDVIYVAGGTAVVSNAVADELRTYAPTVERLAGTDRYSTAVEVSKSAFPVASSGGGDVAALTAAVNALAARVDVLEAENAALQATLSGVSRDGTTLRFTGMNLQVVNGTGFTSSSNSVGNVIIGYNGDPGSDAVRTGSHYLVIGHNNEWTGYAGIVAGSSSRSSSAYASVLGGYGNTASAAQTTVLGGSYNTASGVYSSVTGGINNEASGDHSSVTGGRFNTASGYVSSAAGGSYNTASGDRSSVTGGAESTASGLGASVTGGYDNTASSDYASVTGGYVNTASDWYASVTGGDGNTASGSWASVTGGRNNTAVGGRSSVTGGDGNQVIGSYDTIVGGDGMTSFSGSGAVVTGEGLWDPSD